MSIAYFVVFKDEESNSDTFVNGKNIARVFDDLTSFCKKYSLKAIEDYHSQNVDEFLEDFDDLEIPEQQVLWFEAQEGLDWATTLIKVLKTKPVNFEVKPVIDDLNEYLSVFKQAKKLNVKWHLELDY